MMHDARTAFTPPIRSVVIPMAAGIGNAVLAGPLVRQLYAGLGRPHVTVIAYNRGIAGVFENMAEVAEVSVSGPGPRGLMRFVRWTRRRRPDLYLVPYPSNRWQYDALLATSGARRRVIHGYSTRRRRRADTAAVTRVPVVPGLHDVQQNLRLLTALGVTPDDTRTPRFDLSSDHVAAGDAVLAGVGVKAGEPFVTVHPGSGDTGWGSAKRWPVEHFGALCRRVLDDGSVRQVMVLEGPDEPGLAARVIAATSDAASLVALRLRGPLAQSAAVLRRARLHVGSDSAMAHLASAVGTPTVVIYGPTDPASCRPISAPHRSVRLNKWCAPCFAYPQRATRPTVRCRPPFCINEVSVDSVADAVRQALAGRFTDIGGA